MVKSLKINWFKEPEDHNYPAAISYLSLIYDLKKSENLTSELKKSKIVSFKSKDIFRASGLSLLGISNTHVKKNITKIIILLEQQIEDCKSLSPILLIRDSVNGKVIIADGYHRLCAVYIFDENALIPCKIYKRIK